MTSNIKRNISRNITKVNLLSTAPARMVDLATKWATSTATSTSNNKGPLRTLLSNLDSQRGATPTAVRSNRKTFLLYSKSKKKFVKRSSVKLLSSRRSIGSGSNKSYRRRSSHLLARPLQPVRYIHTDRRLDRVPKCSNIASIMRDELLTMDEKSRKRIAMVGSPTRTDQKSNNKQTNLISKRSSSANSFAARVKPQPEKKYNGFVFNSRPFINTDPRYNEREVLKAKRSASVLTLVEWAKQVAKLPVVAQKRYVPGPPGEQAVKVSVKKADSRPFNDDYTKAKRFAKAQPTVKFKGFEPHASKKTPSISELGDTKGSMQNMLRKTALQSVYRPVTLAGSKIRVPAGSQIGRATVSKLTKHDNTLENQQKRFRERYIDPMSTAKVGNVAKMPTAKNSPVPSAMAGVKNIIPKRTSIGAKIWPAATVSKAAESSISKPRSREEKMGLSLNFKRSPFKFLPVDKETKKLISVKMIKPQVADSEVNERIKVTKKRALYPNQIEEMEEQYRRFRANKRVFAQRSSNERKA